MGGLQGVVELVHERLAGREVELHDLFGRHPVEVLHERAQGVAVRGDEHGRAGAQVGDDRVVPPRQHPLEDVLQALGPGEHVAGERVVPRCRCPSWGRRSASDRARTSYERRQIFTCSARELRAPSPPCPCPGARRSGVRSAARIAAPGSTTVRTRRARARRCGSRAAAPTCARGRGADAACARARTRRGAPRAAPASVRSTSTHPVKRFSRFQVLWPWRSSTSVYGNVLLLRCGTRH